MSAMSVPGRAFRAFLEQIRLGCWCIPSRKPEKPGLAPLMLLLVGGIADAGEIELGVDRQLLRIESRGGLPVHWVTCDRPCDDPDAVRQTLVAPGSGSLRWATADAAQARSFANREYKAEVSATPDAVVAVLTALAPPGETPVVQRYELSRAMHSLRLQLQAPSGVGLRMATGADFVPPPLPGFGASFGDVEAVRVSGDGQERFDEVKATGEIAISPDAWAGIRSRFWAWLARPRSAATIAVDTPEPNRPAVEWRTASGTLDLDVYAGPIEWKSLRPVSAELTQLLFAALWEPLRWLCFGLLFLLAFIMRWVGNAGVAIILLSLAVKIILFPLTRIADRWQAEVNRIQGRLQPRIAGIRRQFRGEEAHNLTLQVYRDEGVHPLFTMKSLAGFAIQVPMFIAAFDMLADNYALAGVRFAWIADLAAPDRFAELPFVVPFFGGHLNLLPAIMTLLTVLSALIQRDESLTPELLKKQQRQLYVMAGSFFLLFYTFPAGMVLYWTANNAWHLLKILALRAWSRR
jgi:YidC/Oxa1 family membrane protein insertase